MSDFHFQRPEFLWVLLLVILILAGFHFRRLRQGSWADVCDAPLLEYLLVDQPRKSKPYGLMLLGLGALLAVLALAGPSWERLPVPVFKNQAALVIVLDLSQSMDAADLKPSRIARARYKITDILKQRQDGHSALVVYSDEAFVVTPLTDDDATIIHQLNILEPSLMPSTGSNVRAGLQLADKLFTQAGVAKGQVLLITDSVDAGALSAAELLKANGRELFVLGVGTEVGAPISQARGGFIKDANGNILVPRLNPAQLQQLASSGGGFYQQMTVDNADVQRLLSTIQASVEADANDLTEADIEEWKDQGAWLILLLLPLAAFAFRRGYIIVLLLVVTGFSPDSDAFEWDNLWKNADQRGKQAFDQQQFESAAEQFNTPEWQAAAHYRAKQFDKAAEILEQQPATTENLYNLGNAQAQLGEYQEALKSYQQVLEQNPQHQDALSNKQAVEQVLQQQKKQQSDDQSQSDEDQQNKDSDDNSEDQQSDDQNQQEQDSAQQDNEQKDSDSEQQNPSDQVDKQQQSAKQEEDSEQQDDEKESEAQPESDQSEEEQEAAEQQRKLDQPTDTEPLDEMDQATEQWLRRIPDDPGGLLRRKFLYQYKQRKQF